MNLSQINQARQLKARLNKAQQELSQTIIEGSSGKGAVKVVMDGQQRVQSIAISPGVIDPANPEQLEKLVSNIKKVDELIVDPNAMDEDDGL